ncbi:glycosyltransferase [bacterium]|nr:glycosyltransferase [bacterium]
MSKNNVQSDLFISVIVNTHNQVELVPKIKNLIEVLEKSFTEFELLLVDSFSEQSTRLEIDRLLESEIGIRHLAISGINNPETFFSAGIEQAVGDYCVFYTPCTDPISIIPESIQILENSAEELLIGSHFTSLKTTKPLLLRPIFSEDILNTVFNPSDFRVVSRQLINSLVLLDLHFKNLFLNLSNTTKDKKYFNYTPLRIGKLSLFDDIRKSVSLSIDASLSPLRIINSTGLLGSAISLLISAYVFLVNYLKTDVIEGWSSISLFISSLMCILFLILTIHGEYLERIAGNISTKRSFQIVTERHSSTLLNTDRINVILSKNT